MSTRTMPEIQIPVPPGDLRSEGWTQAMEIIGAVCTKLPWWVWPILVVLVICRAGPLLRGFAPSVVRYAFRGAVWGDRA